MAFFDIIRNPGVHIALILVGWRVVHSIDRRVAARKAARPVGGHKTRTYRGSPPQLKD